MISLGTWSTERCLALAKDYSNWSRWGADDELGTLNLITDERVAAAGREIVTGERFSLSIPFDGSGPQTGAKGRFNPIHVMIRDGGDVMSGAFTDWYGGVDRHLRTTDDMIIMPLQCATQWDALAHVIHGEVIYNGFSAAEITSAGAKRNSIFGARSRIAGRGVLLDVARAAGKPWLEGGTVVTAADLQATAERQRLEVRSGDIVLVRTGQMAEVAARRGWGDYAGGPAPGLGLECIEWIAANEVAAVASDTWGVEVLPNQTEEIFQPFHLIAVVHLGLTLGEMFALEDLGAACAADGRYSFFFCGLPLAISGAVGSPVNPLAIR